MEELIGKEANREYQKVVKGDVKHTSADTSKAKELLGYEPEIEFEEGLKREVKFLKDLYQSKVCL